LFPGPDPWPRPLAQTWLARAGFYDFGSPSIATPALYSRQLAPGQAGLQGLDFMTSAPQVLQRQHCIPDNSRQGRPTFQLCAKRAKFLLLLSHDSIYMQAKE